MGNCLFPMNIHQQVQPLDVHLLSNDTSSDKYYSAMNDHDDDHQQQPTTVLRIKVKMSTTEFKELMEQCDRGEGDMELGKLIVQECLKGNGEARVVDHQGHDDEKRVMMMSPLETIHEE